MKKQESFTTHLFSVLNHYFHYKSDRTLNSNSKSGIILTNEGILPQKNTQNTFFLTKDTVTAPITINYSDQHDYYDSDSSLNSSVSSSCLSTSSESDYRHRNSISSITLSEILCDHYVNRHSDEDKQVPLETYKVFEASPRRPLYHEEGGDGDDESWFIWDTLQKEKEWIQVLDEIVEAPVLEKSRNNRVNPAHLRMIVAEVNMMRANKIVCPLRPRSSLPPRTDSFYPRLPSPLR